MENKVYDAYGNEILVDDNDFKFLENHQKLSDEKFQTKTTTFAKDAFKRFCKNKSSVVAAFIIGILLLMSLIVPFASSHDVTDSTYPNQALLAPKLFKAGTGFWDGTKHYSNQVYDFENSKVAGTDFSNDFIYNLKLSEKSTVNSAINGAHYGTLILAQNKAVTSAEDNIISYAPYHFMSLSTSVPVTFTVDFNSTDNVFENYELGKYRIYIDQFADDAEDKISSAKAINRYYFEPAWSSDYGTVTVNLNDILTKNGVLSIENAKVGFELLPTTTADKYAYLGLNSFTFSTTATNASTEVLNDLETYSVSDANVQVLLNRTDAGTYPKSIWVPTSGTRRVYQAIIQYASFDYDYYAVKFGDRTMEISANKIAEYVENGSLSIDLSAIESSTLYDSNGYYTGEIEYTVSDDSAIVSIDSIRKLSQMVYDEKGNAVWTTIVTYTGTVTYYKYLGYTSIPKFILGTNSLGYDLFTLAFTSLRTSLALAVLVSAINFTIGLIWGSISGYFGGNVDLIMERITEILSGMPFIVIVTLCILHLGNNIITFAIALCLTGWIGTASRTRTQFYRFRGREYVLASRTLGASNARLIFRHILPNALGTIVTGAVLMIPGVIFSESTLAYLNLGLQGSASFGVLLSDNQVYLSTYPVLIIFPAIIISLLMISFNLFGNGLRDALNPSLKGGE